MEEIVIVGASRTPIGKFGGALASVSAPQLGAHIIRSVLGAAAGRCPGAWQHWTPPPKWWPKPPQSSVR